MTVYTSTNDGCTYLKSVWSLTTISTFKVFALLLLSSISTGSPRHPTDSDWLLLSSSSSSSFLPFRVSISVKRIDQGEQERVCVCVWERERVERKQKLSIKMKDSSSLNSMAQLDELKWCYGWLRTANVLASSWAIILSNIAQAFFFFFFAANGQTAHSK